MHKFKNMYICKHSCMSKNVSWRFASCTYLFVCIYNYTNIWMCTCIHTNTYKHINECVMAFCIIYASVHMLTQMYIYMYVYTYKYKYIHTYQRLRHGRCIIYAFVGMHTLICICKHKYTYTCTCTRISHGDATYTHL